MHFRSEVLASRPLTPSTHCITVERPPDFRFRAGQHAMVALETPEGLEDRFLSIASGPSDPDLEFAVRLSESDFKRAFRSLRPGDRVTLTGPAGRFVRDPERPAALLSGGIGITPLRSMLRDAVQRPELPPTLLLYGNRTPDEIPFRSELDELAGEERVRIVHIVEEPNDHWSGAVGRIDATLLAESLRDLRGNAVSYVCGPPGMVTALRASLADLGVEPGDIRHEPFTGY